MAPEPYRYRELEDNEIRVLVVAPASDRRAALGARLEHVSIDSEPEAVEDFEAVSYVWGDKPALQILSLDDGSIAITLKVEEALRRFRYSDQARRLWIDCICIDQSNVTEKSKQVPLMGFVYHAARRVLVFMDPIQSVYMQNQASGEVTPVSMDNTEIVEVAHIARARGIDTVDQYLAADPIMLLRSLGLMDFLDIMNNKLRLSPLSYMCADPWFTRVWTVQEAVLARSLTFYLGPLELNWDDFETVCLVVHLNNTVGVNNVGFLQFWGPFRRTAWPIVETKYQFSRLNEVSRQRVTSLVFDTWHSLKVWSHWLMSFRSRSCKDDRDRVYGFLGLLPPEIRAKFTPDYTVPVEHLYNTVASLLLSHGISRQIYWGGLWRRQQIHTETGTPFHHLSSWASDYRVNNYRCLIGPSETGDVLVAGRAESGDSFSVEETGEPRPRLRVKGDLFDLVTHSYKLRRAQKTLLMTGVMQNSILHFFIIRQEIFTMKALIESWLAGREYPTGENWVDVLGIILLGGVDSQLIRDDSQLQTIPEDCRKPKMLWEIFMAQAIFEDGDLLKTLVAEKGNGNLALPSVEWHANVQGDEAYAWTLLGALRRAVAHHSIFMTDDGYLGTTSCNTGPFQANDRSVGFIDGLQTPFILRHEDIREGTNSVVGPCYVHGLPERHNPIGNKDSADQTFILLV